MLVPALQKIVPRLLEILEKVGRWVWARMLENDVDAVITYMRLRLHVFKKKQEKYKSKAYQLFLAQRIKNWVSAIQYLTEKRELLDSGNLRILDLTYRDVIQSIPEESVNEVFDLWRQHASVPN